jgi:hypothetical protein
VETKQRNNAAQRVFQYSSSFQFLSLGDRATTRFLIFLFLFSPQLKERRILILILILILI